MTNWTNRSIPSTTFTATRESVGEFRVTEGGNQRVTESLLARITEGISWAIRGAIATIWTNRVRP